MTALWYLGRGSGVAALGMLTVAVLLGVAARSGRPVAGLPRFAVGRLHRSSTLLAVIFLGVHIAALTLDPDAQLRLVDWVLPFAGAQRPAWLGLGTLAVDLLAAVLATSALRHRLGPRTWRTIHWLAYAAWPLALLHTLGDGSDTGSGWLRILAASCAALVAAALAWRASSTFRRRTPDITLPNGRT